MGRSPCCIDEANLKKGPWTPEEDGKLMEYIEKHGQGKWRRLPKLAGLNRCGKSCRLRWINYLRPNIRRGKFTEEEEKLIIQLHSVFGNKWSTIAARLPGRTDNEIKNYWNTHVRKKLLSMGIDPVTHCPTTDLNSLATIPNLLLAANLGKALQLTRLRLLHLLLQLFGNSGRSPASAMDASNLIASLDPQTVDQINSASPFVTTSMDHSTTPSLISWSPAEPTLELGPIMSPPFEPCCGVNLGDLDCDLSWKDILDKLQ